MTYAEKINGEWITKTPRQFRTERNASIPEARLADEGLHEVTVDPKPDAPGQIVEQGPIVDRKGLPVQTWITRDPTPEEFEQEKSRKLHEVNRAYSEAMKPISDAYPIEEREGWFEQVQAARDVKGGNANPLVDALRKNTGEGAVAISDKIIALRDQYLTVYGQHTGTKRGLIAQVNAATTKAELDAIDVKGAFV